MNYKITLYWSKKDYISKNITASLKHRKNKNFIKCISIETIAQYGAYIPSYIKSVPCLVIKNTDTGDVDCLYQQGREVEKAINGYLSFLKEQADKY